MSARKDAPFYKDVSSRYGAPMGRLSDRDMTGKLTLVRVPPYDGGDYDPGGAYWGSVAGSPRDKLPPLWCAWGEAGACYLRAKSREEARAKVLADNPRATIDEGVRDEIIDACAWILWAQAWISYQEDPESEIPEDERVNPGAGGSWDGYVPETPANVREGAVKLIGAIERLNGAPIDVLYARAVALPGKHREDPTPERFGTCLGYEATGAGVSWSDDHPDHGLKVPDLSVYACSDTEADVGNVDERFA